MYILGLHSGGHDSCAALFNDYELVAAVQKERLTRVKCDGKFPVEAIDEVLEIGGITRQDIGTITLTRNYYPTRYLRGGPLKDASRALRRLFKDDKYKDLMTEMRRQNKADIFSVFKKDAFLADNGFRPDTEVFFQHHHLAHALSALFFTDWDNALVYTADGYGDNLQYSMHHFAGGELKSLYATDNELDPPRPMDSVGILYALCTHAIGFKMNRHEGKLTGLAAYGKPTLRDTFIQKFSIDGYGHIEGDFADYKAMKAWVLQVTKDVPREDVAASVQQVLEDLVLASVTRVLELQPADTLALAGGVFANVRLNALLKEKTGVKEIFICPAMGDEGMAIGGPLQFLLERDGVPAWSDKRKRLDNVYLARDYTADSDVILREEKALQWSDNPVEDTAALLADGKVGAIYTGRMEYGPRALGARSILASPSQRDINDSLNDRLQRTEFMPFAPYVLDVDASEVFEIDDANRYACRFMTITTPVKDAWRDKIPAVVHVDGTARPQIIHRDDNPLYYDILKAFKEKTGLPVLVNTSFNAHEEPIINTPQEALRALLDNRMDFIVTEKAVYQIDAANN